MAEGVTLGSQQNVQKYFCHYCSQEVDAVFPHLTCPSCSSGFLEEVSQASDDSASHLSESFLSDDSDLDIELALPPIAESNLQNLMRRTIRRTLLDAMFGPQAISAALDADESDSEGAVGRSLRAELQGSEDVLQGHAVQLPPLPTLAELDEEAFERLRFINWGDYALGEEWDAVLNQILAETDGPAGRPPLPKEEIDAIPIITIDKSHIAQELQCTVCIDDFKLEEKAKALSCSHIFHIECIDPWLERHDSCPVCREPLGQEETSVRSLLQARNGTLSTSSDSNDDDGDTGRESSSQAETLRYAQTNSGSLSDCVINCDDQCQVYASDSENTDTRVHTNNESANCISCNRPNDGPSTSAGGTSVHQYPSEQQNIQSQHVGGTCTDENSRQVHSSDVETRSERRSGGQGMKHRGGRNFQCTTSECTNGVVDSRKDSAFKPHADNDDRYGVHSLAHETNGESASGSSARARQRVNSSRDFQYTNEGRNSSSAVVRSRRDGVFRDNDDRVNPAIMQDRVNPAIMQDRVNPDYQEHDRVRYSRSTNGGGNCFRSSNHPTDTDSVGDVVIIPRRWGGRNRTRNFQIPNSVARARHR